MKLSIKLFLTLTILFLGYASCAEELFSLEHVEKEKLEFALKHPNLVVNQNLLDEKDENYEFFTDYKPDPRDKAHGFFSLSLSLEEKNKLSQYFIEHASNINLDEMDNTDLKAKIEKQFEQKKKLLRLILENLPAITENTIKQEVLLSHINGYIADNLEFDLKRFSFSNLHKAFESIKGTVEVSRKKKDFIDAVQKIIIDSGNIVKNDSKPKIEFKIKRSAANNSNSSSFNKQINLIAKGFEAADKSTSSPYSLFITLSVCSLLSIALLTHKVLTTESRDEEEDEEDEECGAQ